MSEEVYNAIKSRRAVRQFRDEPLPDEAVRRILNAGRLSGSAKNRQPWHFVAVRNREMLRALSTCAIARRCRRSLRAALMPGIWQARRWASRSPPILSSG
jgi:nitroreductase